MPAATRSAVLWALRAASSKAIYTTEVPAGELWLIKTIGIVYEGGTAIPILVILRGPADAATYLLDESVTTSVQRQTWVVADTGSVLELNNAPAGTHIWVSGTRLPETD